jgi:hypothetical protein
MKKMMLLLTTICCFAHAGEIYKWTDENGKVHFGDRSAAPAEGKKIDVRVQPPSSSSSENGSRPEPQRPDIPPALFSPAPPLPIPSRPSLDPAKKSVPVDPARVGPKCQGLIDQIAKVPPGTPWQSLSKEFNASCPGIAYECINYRSHPENNKCTWVERSGSDVLQTKSYP